MKNRVVLSIGISLLLGVLSAQAQVTMSPLATWSPNGDGWFAPGEGGYTFLGTANNERGLGYGNGHVYLVSRNGGSFIRILDPTTGADLGSLNNSGISGGTFAVNTIGVGGDGVVYVNNLTTQSTTSPLKVYSWLNEGSTPAVAYSGNGGLAGSRVGDSLAAIGSGSSTRLALGYGSSPAVTGNNGYAIIYPTAGTAASIGFGGTPPNAGDFRLGITFADSSHVIGTQGSSLYRYTDIVVTNGILLGSPSIPDPAGATADRLLSYKVVGWQALLAVQSIGDSHVSIYDATDPANPVWLVSGNNTSGTLTANANGTGQLAWGDPVYNPVTDKWSATLYAMSSNQGIQAFVVTIPEPGALALTMLGLVLTLWRKARK